MARHINVNDVTRTVKVMVEYMYITKDHEGVQILTQWDTGIKSCQKAVLKTAKQYFPLLRSEVTVCSIHTIFITRPRALYSYIF